MFMFGCNSEVIDLNAQDSKELISSVNDLVIIDIRTPEEFESGHLENAINIDFYGEFKNNIDKLDKSKSYLIYCRTGSRSRSAKQIMSDLGFKSIYHMQSGITEWISKGYPVV